MHRNNIMLIFLIILFNPQSKNFSQNIHSSRQVQNISYSQFIEHLENNEIYSATIIRNEFHGFLKHEYTYKYFKVILNEKVDFEKAELWWAKHEIDITFKDKDNGIFSLFLNFLPFVIITCSTLALIIIIVLFSIHKMKFSLKKLIYTLSTYFLIILLCIYLPFIFRQTTEEPLEISYSMFMNFLSTYSVREATVDDKMLFGRLIYDYSFIHQGRSVTINEFKVRLPQKLNDTLSKQWHDEFRIAIK